MVSCIGHFCDVPRRGAGVTLLLFRHLNTFSGVQIIRVYYKLVRNLFRTTLFPLSRSIYAARGSENPNSQIEHLSLAELARIKFERRGAESLYYTRSFF